MYSTHELFDGWMNRLVSLFIALW